MRIEPIRHLVLVLASALAGTAGCALLLTPQPRPSALAGEWLDVSAGVERDSQVMVLSRGGVHRHLYIAIRRDGRVKTRTIQRGMWYFAGDTLRAGRPGQLCFIRRPGRDGASCQRMDVLEDSLGGIREILLWSEGRQSRFIPRGRSEAAPAPRQITQAQDGHTPVEASSRRPERAQARSAFRP